MLCEDVDRVVVGDGSFGDSAADAELDSEIDVVVGDALGLVKSGWPCSVVEPDVDDPFVLPCASAPLVSCGCCELDGDWLEDSCVDVVGSGVAVGVGSAATLGLAVVVCEGSAAILGLAVVVCVGSAAILGLVVVV